MNNHEPQGPGALDAHLAAVGQGAAREPPGAQLMAARRAQGLSLGDIARQLKLSVRQIEALERDDYTAFSGPVFVRGFLRNYAKLLHLDPDILVTGAAIPATAGGANAAPSAPVPLQESAADRGRRVSPGTLVGAAVLLVLLVAAIYETREKPSPVSRTPVEPSPPAVAATPQHADSPPGASVEGSPAQSPIPAAPPAAAGTAALPVPGPAAAVPAEPVLGATAAPAQVKLAFDGESWVEIKDKSGTVILSRLNAGGSERVVEGEPPLTLVIGNAHAVRLSFRNKPVDLVPHTRVDVARITLE